MCYIHVWLWKGKIYVRGNQSSPWLLSWLPPYVKLNAVVHYRRYITEKYLYITYLQVTIINCLLSINPLTPRACCQKLIFWTIWKFQAGYGPN